MVLRGENGTAFPGKLRNRDGFARAPSVSGSFSWGHDWIPLGRLNDVAAVRGQDTRRRPVTVTLIQSVPWTSGYALACCTLDDRIPTGFTTGP
jgi:hypothetical protein